MDLNFLLEKLRSIEDPPEGKTDRGSYAHLAHYFATNVLNQFADFLPKFKLARVLIGYQKEDLAYNRKEANVIAAPLTQNKADIITAMAALVTYIALAQDERAGAITRHLFQKHRDKSLVLLATDPIDSLGEAMIWEIVPAVNGNWVNRFGELSDFLANQFCNLRLEDVLAADATEQYYDALRREKSTEIKHLVDEVAQEHETDIDADSKIRMSLLALLMNAAGCNSFWLVPNPFFSREIPWGGLYLLSPEKPTSLDRETLREKSFLAALLAREVFLRSHVLERGYRQLALKAEMEVETEKRMLFDKIRKPLDRIRELQDQILVPFMHLQSILSPARGIFAAVQSTARFFPIPKQNVPVNQQIEPILCQHECKDTTVPQCDYLDQIALVLLAAFGETEQAGKPLWSYLNGVLTRATGDMATLALALRMLLPEIDRDASLLSWDDTQRLFNGVKNCLFYPAKRDRDCPLEFLFLLFYLWAPKSKDLAPPLPSREIRVATRCPVDTAKALEILHEIGNGFTSISFRVVNDSAVVTFKTLSPILTSSNRSTLNKIVKQHNNRLRGGESVGNEYSPVGNWVRFVSLLSEDSPIIATRPKCATGFASESGSVLVLIPDEYTLEINWSQTPEARAKVQARSSKVERRKKKRKEE